MSGRIVLATTVDVSLTLLKGYPEFLASRGWDVHVVSSGGPRLSELGTLDGVTTHTIPMKREPAVLSDAVALKRWIRLMRRLQPDVVSLGTPKASLLGLVASRWCRVPARQYVLRGLRLHTARGPLRGLLWLSERVATAMSTDVVAVSTSLRREAIDLKLTRPGRISVVGEGSSNGVDLEQFNPSRFDARSKKDLADSLALKANVPVVGFVGRLTRDKGIDTLLKAVERMQVRGTPVQLLLVGGFDDKQSRVWVRDARARGVEFTVVDHVADPAEYVSLFDVACIPSLREGFCNAAAEASAMGIAVVGTRVTGLVDPVLDGVTGLLSRVADDRALADNLSLVIENRDLSARLGAEGARYIRNSFERKAVQTLYEARLRMIMRTD